MRSFCFYSNFAQNRIRCRFATTATRFLCACRIQWPMWCYLIFVHAVHWKWFLVWHEFKAGFKKPLWLRPNPSLNKTLNESACANVCLHLVCIFFFEKNTHRMEWVTTRKVLQVWKKNLASFFCWSHNRIKCEENLFVYSVLCEQKGCLLDCLHLSKNIKWSVYASLKTVCIRRGTW